MQIPSGEGEEMVNSLLVTQGNFNSPSHGLAIIVKKRIPKGHSRLCLKWLEFFFSLQLLNCDSKKIHNSYHPFPSS